MMDDTLLYKADYGDSGVNSKSTGCGMATAKDNYKCFIRVYDMIGQVYLSSIKGYKT